VNTVDKYKALWEGKTCLFVDRFLPSSKCCSNCGWKDVNLTLKDRIFKCQNCGLVICRDLNGAINVKYEGIRLLRGTQEASAASEQFDDGKPVETRGCRAAVQCLSNEAGINNSKSYVKVDC